ncbi:uncharacterized protein LOC113348669 [Papaver somniferum]|uniref:uncharacterized protein LOC113348669 n=1 Tax=Papaver somniferum TaxID=3469 RepID=UPI000E6FB548|nr:uncharacterized protein LOC113348669 [Papaver somniferum]
MFLKKLNSQFHIDNGGGEGFDGKRSGVNRGGRKKSQRKSVDVDHWGFLEEIDAPMWVDLKLESKSMYQDIDDAWFQTTHPFHQCSSHKLMAEFSALQEEQVTSNADLLGSASAPELPPSVSKSRGKNYKSKEWKGNDQAKVGDKQHPIKVLNRKIKRVVPGVSHDVKAKASFPNSRHTSSLKTISKPGSLQTKSSSGYTKCTSSLKTTAVSESSSNGSKKPNIIQTKTSFGVSESKPTVKACSVGETSSDSMQARNSSSSSSSSTGTMVQSCQSQPYSDVRPTELFGRNSDFFSDVKISLRRSIVTRQASRVEVRDGREIQSSSSSKSSVESPSSSNSDPKDIKRAAGNSITMAIASQHTNQYIRNGTTISKSSSSQCSNLNSKFQRERVARQSSYIYQDKPKLKASKTKVSYQADPRRSLRVRNAQEQNSLGLKAKKLLADSGKVYPGAPVGPNRKANVKDDTFKSKLQCPDASKNGLANKDGKGPLEEKADGRIKGKNPKTLAQKKVYFR